VTSQLYFGFPILEGLVTSIVCHLLEVRTDSERNTSLINATTMVLPLTVKAHDKR
jgi:hypothetical protein